jgi:protein-disulfide isomerase
MGILNLLDLDQQRFAADMNSREVSDVIARDIADGGKMGVRATPEFFVNGQPLPSWGFEQLRQLVDETVAGTY